MTEMFTVQSGVPLPEVDRRPKRLQRKHPIDDLQPGQMYFIPWRVDKSISAYVSRVTKNLPGQFSARRCWMRQEKNNVLWKPCNPADKGATEGTGVWRIE